MQNEITQGFLEANREHTKNIYHVPNGSPFKQRSSSETIDDSSIKNIKIDQLSYEEIKALDDEHLKIALDYLHKKYGGLRAVGKVLKISHTSLDRFESKRNYKFQGTDKPLKNKKKPQNKAPQAITPPSNSDAHIAKIEYEITNTNSTDIKNVVNLFLNQIDENKKYNLFFKVTEATSSKP